MPSTPQDELAGGVVNHLAGHGIELELRLESLDRHRFDGQKVEEQRAVRAGRQRNQFSLFLRGLNVFVDFDQIGRFAAHRRTVIDDFYL